MTHVQCSFEGYENMHHGEKFWAKKVHERRYFGINFVVHDTRKKNLKCTVMS